MYYTHFGVENFKGIRKLDLHLEGAVPGNTRIHALVGLNESGKTTVLEAIDRFTGGAEDVDPSEISGRIRPHENDLVPVARRSNFNGQINISARVRVGDEDLAALKKHMRAHGGHTVVDFPNEIEVSDQYNFTNSLFVPKKATFWPSTLGHICSSGQRKPRVLAKKTHNAEWFEVVNFLKKRMPAIWYFPDFLFDFPTRVFLRPQSSESVRDTFYRSLLQDVLDVLDSGMTVDDHLLARFLSSESADRRALNNLVLEMSRKLTTEVFGAWNRILNRDVNMRISLSVDSEVRPSTGTNEPFMEFRIEDSDGFFYVQERSLGFRWFFVFLLLTTFRGMRSGTDREVLFLFDEPASNLHPSAQAQLLSSLERLTTNCRVMYTTHSPHLINPDWLESTFVVRNRGADSLDDVTVTARQTDIAVEPYRAFVSNHPDQSQYFQPILDVLDYVPSRLELVDRLVLLEGKNDYYTLRYAELVIGATDLSFYPGGGAGTLDTVIGLYLAWGRDFLVLLDSDSEGKKQRERYVERFGPVLERRILIVSDLLPGLGGKALDAIFSDDDRASICNTTAASPRPSKRVFFRHLQEAVATRRSPAVVDEHLAQQLQIVRSALLSAFDSANSER